MCILDCNLSSSGAFNCLINFLQSSLDTHVSKQTMQQPKAIDNELFFSKASKLFELNIPLQLVTHSFSGK